MVQRFGLLLLDDEPVEDDDVDNEEGGRLDEGNLLEWLFSFFFCPSQTPSDLTCRTLASFNPAGRTQLQKRPKFERKQWSFYNISSEQKQSTSMAMTFISIELYPSPLWLSNLRIQVFLFE